jgi:hypothetical protein
LSKTLYRCDGGAVVLPDAKLTLVDRQDGGNLIVNPPREVWERSELSPGELTRWSFLVAATGKAMLDALAQLDGGCINYWEAGNWALNDEAEPKGPKTPREHRRVHLHLLGRSPQASDPSWRWGEAPRFPDFSDRFRWASAFERLTGEECARVIVAVDTLVKTRYAMAGERWQPCKTCGYPAALGGSCGECP